ncbi:MAG TPA: helix-turn-helix transcriptional regulator [Burkholderiales bacterium]|jgi:transcriptional regulator with XRE-family HTH domain|nr:helix-turn-helix transcriptional regulator [Burkholderiales bacterium]
MPRATASAAPTPDSFGDLLRYWRGKRGNSQLELAGEAAISQRHLSFLESGRSQPSREMVLKLGLVLDIPLRQRNLMLTAAGFAAAYSERDLTDPELREVKRALDFMLAQAEPFPVIVVDRLWNLVMRNAAAGVMMQWLTGAPAEESGAAGRDSAGEINIVRLLLHPQGVRAHVANWREVAGDVVHWIHREAIAEGPAGPAHVLLDELLKIDGIPADWRTPNLESRVLPFLPLLLNRDGVELKLFTTVTTLGTPHDVTLHELRMESFFPADEATAAWFRARRKSTKNS